MIYPRKSRLPVLRQQKLLEHFVAGTTARAAALLVGVQANTAKLFYQRLRQLIASKQESYLLAGEDVLDVSEFHHRRVNHSKVFVSEQGHHINGIENFWNQAKRHLRRFNGIPRGSFYRFLKECEWRYGVSTVGAIKRCYSSSEPGIGSKSPGLSYSSPL